MPLLDASGLIEDRWSRQADSAFPIVAWDDLPAAQERIPADRPLALDIPNSVAVATLLPFLTRLSLIAINFPSFADGRGFSLARVLRREGFKGRLRATGPLIADQFAYALSCGFDEVEVPQSVSMRQPVEQWIAALHAIGDTYQRGYSLTGNILDLRRQAHRKPVWGKPMSDPAEKAAQLAHDLASLAPADRLALLCARTSGRRVLTTSFGAEDQILTHLVAQGKSPHRSCNLGYRPPLSRNLQCLGAHAGALWNCHRCDLSTGA